MRTFYVNGRAIGDDSRPFIIAEMSGNHNQSLERALQIVDAAAATGVDALKLQTYTPDTMTLDLQEGSFYIEDETSLWKGNSLYELYKQAYTPWEWHLPIMERCRQHGLLCFSTPFDETAVDFLETLDVPLYKIASFENSDLPLIQKVAATGKPIILSTGMATVAELDEAVRTARAAGCPDIVLLKCTSTYPASPENSNIVTIPHMRKLFGCQVGLSDHTLGLGVAVASVTLGATVIEKHFTLSRAEGGVDSVFSMEAEEMRLLVTETERAWQALGQVQYGPQQAELKSMKFRRSLYITRDLEAGEALSSDSMRAIRPGYGLSPKYYSILLGKRISKHAPKGTPLSWELFE
ncbi:pseudaminic acid synthase [Paenibacillus athensensis]|uniref:Pseudaminic acid synthase n=1 Tax=Paenibacillus athensensis TaxID=1967502 RepID=A0A4Y8Q4H1_9BACL|nr:pseudaminic acid synthase [Paenibacillus athensensis]MCD1260830.1 pseudaminic acid synthase [Paenibacillus athensensis]